LKTEVFEANFAPTYTKTIQKPQASLISTSQRGCEND